MSENTFKGCYSDLRFIKGRRVCQVVLEVPLEEGSRIVEVFGAPNPASEVWVAFARLAPEARREEPVSPPFPGEPKPDRHRWSELSPAQQTGIIRKEPEFQEFVCAQNAAEAADYIREHCGVRSCAEIAPNTEAARLWNQLQIRYGNYLRQKRGAA